MSDTMATVSRVETGEPPMIRIDGEIDMSNASWVESEVTSVMDDVRRSALDLTGVTFVDSSGVALLQRLAMRRRDAGATLVVIAPENGIVEKLLRLTQLTDLLDLRSTP